MSQGKIVQCIGAVIDVEFARDQMPHIYDALTMDGSELTLEVQQQLGDGIVRTIAMGTTDGLMHGRLSRLRMLTRFDRAHCGAIGRAGRASDSVIRSCRGWTAGIQSGPMLDPLSLVRLNR
jgi:hypothetical protein